jgi:hypothetical protein
VSKVLQRVKDGYTYAADLDLIIMTCPDCGVVYAIPRTLQANAYKAGNRRITWYCPNGHDLGYNGKSEEEKRAERAEAALERTRQQAQAEHDLRRDTERRLRAQKGATTRAKRRHASGTCPCCSRSFVQLKRHMAAKHPDYLAEHGIEPQHDERAKGGAA